MPQRPRWTEPELNIINTARKEGKKRDEIVTAYKAAFPDVDRSDKIILARIIKLEGPKRKRREKVDVMPTPIISVIENLGTATAAIYSVLAKHPDMQRQIIGAVAALCGIEISPFMTGVYITGARPDLGQALTNNGDAATSG